MNHKTRTITVLLAVLLFLASCGYKEGVVNSERKSYLQFTGNTSGAVVYLDDDQPFELKKNVFAAESTDESERESLVHFQTTPGKHTVVVKRDGQVLVNRSFMIGNGMTKEIQIP